MKTTFRRGFKTQSSNLVAEVRAELGLDLVVPLDPSIVAAEYGVAIVTTDQEMQALLGGRLPPHLEGATPTREPVVRRYQRRR